MFHLLYITAAKETQTLTIWISKILQLINGEVVKGERNSQKLGSSHQCSKELKISTRCIGDLFSWKRMGPRWGSKGSGWGRAKAVKVRAAQGRGGKHSWPEARWPEAWRLESQEHQAKPFVLRTFIIDGMGEGEEVIYWLTGKGGASCPGQGVNTQRQ